MLRKLILSVVCLFVPLAAYAQWNPFHHSDTAKEFFTVTLVNNSGSPVWIRVSGANNPPLGQIPFQNGGFLKYEAPKPKAVVVSYALTPDPKGPWSHEFAFHYDRTAEFRQMPNSYQVRFFFDGEFHW